MTDEPGKIKVVLNLQNSNLYLAVFSGYEILIWNENIKFSGHIFTFDYNYELLGDL